MTIEQDIQDGLPREGRTRLRFLRKAFGMLPDLHRPRILDIGCGDGGPTLELARLAQTTVVGLDIDAPSLCRLLNRAQEAGFCRRIRPVRASMREVPFADGSFDVVWSEGAADPIGFRVALEAWRRLVRPRGFLVVHDVIWLRPDPPEEAVRYWKRRHPGIETADEHARGISLLGYELVGSFSLPEGAWWLEYYGPLASRLRTLVAKYDGNDGALDVLERRQKEVDLYKRSAPWYGSAYFVMRRIPRVA